MPYDTQTFKTFFDINTHYQGWREILPGRWEILAFPEIIGIFREILENKVQLHTTILHAKSKSNLLGCI